MITVSVDENTICLNLCADNISHKFICVLAKMSYQYDTMAQKIKIEPPFIADPRFNAYKNQCREVLRHWLDEFLDTYKQPSFDEIKCLSLTDNQICLKYYKCSKEKVWFSYDLIQLIFAYKPQYGFVFQSTSHVHPNLCHEKDKCIQALEKWANDYLIALGANERVILSELSEEFDFSIAPEVSSVLKTVPVATKKTMLHVGRYLPKPHSGSCQRSCSSCGKSFDCSEAFELFATGCSDYVPSSEVF